MKRFWFVVSALFLVLLATLMNSYYLKQFTQQLTATLVQAQYSAGEGAWASAEELTQAALYQWEHRSGYLHIVLRHNDTNQVEISFREAQTYLEQQEQSDYSATNARLRTEIGLIYEMERLSLKNVF